MKMHYQSVVRAPFAFLSSRPLTSIYTALCLVPLLALGGCLASGDLDADTSEAVDSPEELGAVEEPIINGTAMPAADSGFVKVKDNCSGTLLTNSWVLTAKHCLLASNISTPSTISVVYGAQTRWGGFAKPHPDPNVDVALVYVSSPFVHKGQTWGYKMGLYADSSGNLIGKTLFCAGYGRSTLNGGSGTLRSALLTVKGGGVEGYTLTPNSSGQIQWLGDTGGSCQLDVKGGRFITGVQKESNYDPATQKVDAAYQVGAGQFRQWALETMISPARFEGPWTNPLPNNSSDSTTWDPCGGGCFTWTAAHSFESGYDFGTIGGQSMTGSGPTTGSACGPTSMQVSTDSSVQSAGFSSVHATCKSAFLCSGPGCSTSPAALPDSVNMSTLYKPCPAGCFTWTATYNMEWLYDIAFINGLPYSGVGSTSGTSCNAFTIGVQTDTSISSAGMQITATCAPPSP